MKINMGSIDRGVRAAAGVVLVVWALAGGPWWAWVGVILLATAAIGFCPLYVPFGISTGAKK